MSRSTFLVLLGGMALACGGGGDGVSFVNPDNVKFEYTSYSDVSGTTLDAAAAGEAGANDALALTDAAEASHAESLANLPDAMGNAVFSDTLPAVRAAAKARIAMAHRAAAYATGDLVTAATGFDNPDCVTINAISVNYDHCTLTETDIDGTMTLTVTGSLTRGLTSVDWAVTVSMGMTFYDTGGNISIRVSSALTGHVAVSEVSADLWNVAGYARSQNAASASGQGQSLSFAFTHNADIDLDYQPSIPCVVGGTIELKRVWSERPSGATAADLPNVGVNFQWMGCGVVQVSWGVLQ